MELFFWDHFKEEVSPAIKYWVDYWIESIELYKNPKEKMILENPSTLLSLLKDEIDFNGLKSNDMKKYFASRIKFYLEQNYLLDPISLGYFQMIHNSISSEPEGLIYWNADACQKHMSTGEYVKYLTKTLRTFLIENGDREKIKHLTNALVVEFYIAGFSTKYITAIPKKIFSFYSTISAEVLICNFPHRLIASEFLNERGEHDYRKYDNAVKELIQNLSLKDRLDAVLNFYQVDESEMTYIFQLKGAYGEGAEIKIKDVHIYSPKSFRYVKNNPTRNAELFLGPSEIEVTPANVAVKIKIKDHESSKGAALSRIREVLNFLQFYLSSNVRLSVVENKYLVVDQDGKSQFESFSADKNDDFWFWNDSSINLNEFPEDARSGAGVFNEFFLNENQNKHSNYSSEQISHALHFLDKSKKSETGEDKLLNLWVCLEKVVADRKTLFSLDKTKYELIVSSIPYVVMDSYYSKGWEVFHYLRNLYTTLNNNHRVLPLKLELAKKIHFETDGRGQIYLKDFIDNLDEVYKSTDKEIVKEKISELNDFYSDGPKAAKMLVDDIENIQRDLLLIYRMRNKIVHDAHFDSLHINFWAKRLNYYVHLCLSSLVKNACDGKERNYDYLLQRKVAFLHKCSMLKGGKEKVYDVVFNDH
jgi:hypothetical protein